MLTPERYRVKTGFIGTDPFYGNNGVFKIPISSKTTLFAICSDGGGWEHVSVSVEPKKGVPDRTPTWSEMCKVKDLFWSEDDCVVQYHPPKSEYINNHKHCLHLWKKIGEQFETPPSIMVGIKC